MFKTIVAIIIGHTKDLLEIEEDFENYRLEEFCKKCASSHIPVTGEYSGKCLRIKDGCGNCSVSAKTKQNLIGCPLGFWGTENGENYTKPKGLEVHNRQWKFIPKE